MIAFLIGAAVALVATLLLLLRPFLWQRARATASHRQLNTAIYRDQMAELERDRAAGTLAEEDYRQALAELQRRVLEDGQDDAPAATLKAPKKTLIALALLLPAASIALYLLFGHPEATNAIVKHQVTAQDVERMVATLAAKLEKDPDNLPGWTMLARSYKAMGRLPEAERAYAHLAERPDADAQALADYADVLAAKAGGNFDGKPQQLIDRALKADPNNAEALWLAGTAAFEAGRYQQAILIWTRLQMMVPPQSEEARQIGGAIAEARAKAGMAAPAYGGKRVPGGGESARRGP